MSIRLRHAAVVLAGLLAATPAMAQERPNILVMFGDDVGFWNVSAYNQGMMGYQTPNIDRIAQEGAVFTDAYAQQSCTAGRAAFITGQSPIRTGMLKVGLPGAPEGLMAEDPTIADLLGERGYATGQFGKNHLGIATNSSLPFTDSTSSSGISTISTPRKSRRIRTTRMIPRSRTISVLGAYSTAGPQRK